jgi:hypothetical protein
MLEALKKYPIGISLVIFVNPKYTAIKETIPTTAPVKTGTGLYIAEPNNAA